MPSLTEVAEIVLIQEATIPRTGSWAVPAGFSSWPSADEPWPRTPNNGAPAAVVALTDDLRLRGRDLDPTLRRSRQGTLALADVLTGDEILLTVASGYGMFESRNISEVSMNLILDELGPVIEDRSAPVVFGGDFNMWIQPYQGAPWPAYEETFTRMHRMGLFDCLRAGAGPKREPLEGCPCGGGVGCDHVRTLRHNRQADSTPWQVDYLFATEELRPPVLRSCRTIESDDIWSASDHCPVVAEFDLTLTSIGR